MSVSMIVTKGALRAMVFGALLCANAGIAAAEPSADNPSMVASDQSSDNGARGLRVRGRSSEPALVALAADPKGGVDALLADDNLEEATPPTRFFGFDQFEVAYTLPHTAHFSKLENRLELGAQGAWSANLKWKISGRFDYDGIYDLSNFYSTQVKKDQRYNGQFRETFVDVGAGDVDFRIGRQQIIWGEVVGLFVADVVSAKDQRESVVQDFDLLRIPQWAARAEYFKNDIHLEAIWIPFPSFNKIGKPGSNFFPFPPPPPQGTAFVINNEIKPKEDGSDQNFGLRGSMLRNGWDVAAFAYRSIDANPSFFRQVVSGPAPAYIYTPRHENITQYGSTVSKDFDDFLFKAEAVYTVGGNFNTTSLADGDGIVSQNYLDYILSIELPMANEAHFNAQFFQRVFSNHDPNIIPSKVESGVTLFWSGKWDRKFEPQILLIHSLNRNDWLLRPKLVWNFQKEWRAVAGADVFGGHQNGLFGQFDKQDRVYVEVRRSF
jgi:hypothetical protein